MKTIEQGLDTVLHDAPCGMPNYSEDDYNAGFLVGAEYGFSKGIEYAQQWIDVDIEKPKNLEIVLVKYKTAKGIEKVGIAKYHKPFPPIDGGFIIQGSCPQYITHWRPIELV